MENCIYISSSFSLFIYLLLVVFKDLFLFFYLQILGDGQIRKSDGYNGYQYSKAKETTMDLPGDQSLGPCPAPYCHCCNDDRTLCNL